MKNLLLGMTLLVLVVPTLSAQKNEFEQSKNQVICQHKQQRCTYAPENVTANTVVQRLNNILFPGTILAPEEGFINVISYKEFEFWIHDQNILNRLISLIPFYDVLEEFTPSALIHLTTDIYNISENGLSEIRASISEVMTNLLEAPSLTVGEGLSPTAVKLNLNIGNDFMAAMLGAQRTKENITQVTSISQFIPNLASINYQNTAEIFISPTAGIVESQTAGIKISGNASIARQNTDLIVVKDFGFHYGVELPPPFENASGRVSILDFHTPELLLIPGLSSMIVSSTTMYTASSSGVGLSNTGFHRSQMRNKLLVVTKATPYTFEQFKEENLMLRKLKLHQKFSPKEVKNFDVSKVKLKEVLESVSPYSFFTSSGERVLGFKLDRELARKENIKRPIRVKIKGGGLKQQAVRTIENLMLSGLSLDELSLKALQSPLVKLKFELKPLEGGWGSKEKLTLYYNPETNEFYQR